MTQEPTTSSAAPEYEWRVLYLDYRVGGMPRSIQCSNERDARDEAQGIADLGTAEWVRVERRLVMGWETVEAAPDA